MTYFIFAYTAVIYIIGVIIGRFSVRLDLEKDYEKKEV